MRSTSPTAEGDADCSLPPYSQSVRPQRQRFSARPHGSLGRTLPVFFFRGFSSSGLEIGAETLNGVMPQHMPQQLYRQFNDRD
jgi:hypothetical protein